MERWAGWPRQARASEAGEPARKESGPAEQSAPGKPSGMPGAWGFPAPWQERSGERGGLVPPHRAN